MAGEPLKVIAFAYADIDLETWESEYAQAEDGPNQALETAISEGNLDLNLVCMLGLKDPIRPTVTQTIKYVRDMSNLQVRLVSGDHINTAMRVAKDIGIIKQSELNDNDVVMTASQFREEVGTIVSKKNEET